MSVYFILVKSTLIGIELKQNLAGVISPLFGSPQILGIHITHKNVVASYANVSRYSIKVIVESR